MFKRPAARSGATLTEVLMALLIMSIGIVSVITMFPLAVLRSIQATQLTNARLLKQNVQQAVRTQYYKPPRNPPPLSAPSDDPEFRFDLMNQTTIVHPVPAPIGSRMQFRGEWQPQTVYYSGEIVVPTRKAGGAAPTPNLWFVCTTERPSLTETSGEIEPSWVANTLIADGSMPGNVSPSPSGGWLAYAQNVAFAGQPVTSRPFQPVVLGGVIYDALNYVVDPLGWQMHSSGLSLNTTVTSANDFGYSSVNSLGNGVAPTTYPGFNYPGLPGTVSSATLANHRLLRVNGGLGALAADATEALAMAEGIGMNGDTWTLEAASLVDSVAPVPIPATPPWTTAIRSAVFPSTVDLSAIALASPGSIRIVFRSVADDQSAVRVLQPIDGATPAVDVATRTVRWREPLPAGFVPDGEARLERVDKRYSWIATVNKTPQGSANITVAVIAKRSFTPDDEHAYAASFTTGLADQATISWGAGEPKPLLREGNYVLDGYTARWYRIIAVSGSESPVTITFDEKVPTNHRVTAGRLIVMRGIIEIFEL